MELVSAVPESEAPEAIATCLLRLDARMTEPERIIEASPEPRGELVAVWGGAGSPGRTTVAVHQLPHPDLVIEIQAVGVLPEEGTAS